MFLHKPKDFPATPRRSATAGVRKRGTRSPGPPGSRINPVPVEAKRGELNLVPCRRCALETGLCYAAEHGPVCFECRDHDTECEPLPDGAIENGKALTAAMNSGAGRFTTALLSKNIRELLRSLEELQSETETEAEQDHGTATRTPNVSRARRGNNSQRRRGPYRWQWDVLEGEDVLVAMNEEEIQPQEDGGAAAAAVDVDEVDKEPEPQAKAPAEDVQARRDRIKALMGALIDELIC